MQRLWKHSPIDGKDGSYTNDDKGEPIAGFYRSAEYANAWVIMGRARSGSYFVIVSAHDDMEAVKREAEETLYDLGWVPRLV